MEQPDAPAASDRPEAADAATGVPAAAATSPAPLPDLLFAPPYDLARDGARIWDYDSQ